MTSSPRPGSPTACYAMKPYRQERLWLLWPPEVSACLPLRSHSTRVRESPAFGRSFLLFPFPLSLHLFPGELSSHLPSVIHSLVHFLNSLNTHTSHVLLQWGDPVLPKPHFCFDFGLLLAFETESCYVAQADLQLQGSSNPSVSAYRDVSLYPPSS